MIQMAKFVCNKINSRYYIRKNRIPIHDFKQSRIWPKLFHVNVSHVIHEKYVTNDFLKNTAVLSFAVKDNTKIVGYIIIGKFYKLYNMY